MAKGAQPKTGKNKNKYMRTYILPHHANQGKVDKVVAVLAEYQKTTKKTQAWQYRRLLNGEGLYNRADPSHIVSQLSQRYKRSVLNHTVAGLKSWTATTQDHFTTIVQRSSLPDQIKHDLHRVNIGQNWYAKTLTVHVPVRVGDVGEEHTEYVSREISQQVLKLSRRIVKQIRKHYNRLPDLSTSTTMVLDGPVSQFEKSNTDTFSYWTRISTLDKGQPVWIPLRDYPFARDGEGQWSALTQVTVVRGTKKGGKDQIVVKQVKNYPLAPPRNTTLPEHTTDGQHTVPVVGIDRGLVTLFATSEGDMLGKSLYSWLKKVDEELTALAKHLQRQHIKPTDSSRYVNMNRRITEYVENEVNRSLNTVVALHNPAEIVAEALDFRYAGLSRRLNRILSRCGMGAMKNKLQSLHETLGITITYVPAAYTSQECSGCGFVNKTNRKSQSRFVCGFCGKKLNADINASYTIRSRRSCTGALQYASRKKVLSYLDHSFEMRWGISPAIIRDRISSARKSKTKHSSKKRPTADGLNEQLNVSSSQLEFHSRELVVV